MKARRSVFCFPFILLPSVCLLFFGGVAQTVVQRRAKPPGLAAPVRSSRTASAFERMKAGG